MSELQELFKARNKIRSSSADGDDNNSENAIIPELQSNAPSQTVTSNYTNRRSNTAPHSPIHTSNINSNDGGIEVSPSAIGRQSLQLNNTTTATLFPTKDGPPATPPSMPSYTGKSSNNPPIGRVNPSIKGITPRDSGRQLPSPTGGSHGRREISQDSYK